MKPAPETSRDCSRFCGLGGLLLRFGRRQAHRLDDLVGSGCDPAAIVARLEARQDGFADDHARHRVGQEHAGAVAGLDPHLLLVRSDKQDDAVIFLRVAELPVAAQAIAIILDRPPFEAVDRRDDKGASRLGIKRLGFRIEVELLLGPQEVRLVDNRRLAVLRKGLRRSRRRQRNQRQPQDAARRSCSPQPVVLKSTLGAFCEPAAASNGTLGLAP